MNQDEIIAMANQAAAQHGHTYEPEPADGTIEFLGSFAALVAAKEREACAQSALAQGRSWDPHALDPQARIAAAIRARGAA